MDCYECAKRGGAAGHAVALCGDCGAGLCLEHVRETAAWRGAGGTAIGCAHDPWRAPARAAAPAAVPEYSAAPAPA